MRFIHSLNLPKLLPRDPKGNASIYFLLKAFQFSFLLELHLLLKELLLLVGSRVLPLDFLKILDFAFREKGVLKALLVL